MKRLVTLVLAAAALALGGTSALAAGVEKPVSFVMTSAQCPHLPPGTTITGTGTEKSIEHVTTDRKGITTIHNVTHSHGTAKDQAGNTYVFNYANSFRISNSATSPAVFSGLMIDAFSLAGRGPARLHNGFIAVFTLEFGTTPEPTARFQELHSRGDPIDFDTGEARCDPL